MWEALAAEFPDTPRYRHQQAWAYRFLSDALRNLQRYQDAEEAYRQALGIWEALAAEFPDIPKYGGRAGDIRFELRMLLNEAGRAGGEQDALPEALETRRGLRGLKVERLPLTAQRLDGVRIDGVLDEWMDVEAHVTADQERVRDNPQAWTGPDDCSFTTRIAYDTENLYLAMDVNDDRLASPSGPLWWRDGIEVFWDPRAPGPGVTPFAGPCRQLLIPVPPAGQQVSITAQNVSDFQQRPDWTLGSYSSPSSLASALGVGWKQREGGYVFELAIPLDAIGSNFVPSPDAVLAVTVFVNDRDDANWESPTSCMVLSGHSYASRYTDTYAVVTFE
jgi:hypothetical protein